MRSLFERLWKDSMYVHGWVVFTENNITKHKEIVKKSNIRCHYSQATSTITGDSVTAIDNTHKLFCSAGVVAEGDKVVVTQRNDKIVTLTVGEGFPYQGGVQYRVKRRDKV